MFILWTEGEDTLFREWMVIWFHWHLLNIRITTEFGQELLVVIADIQIQCLILMTWNRFPCLYCWNFKTNSELSLFPLVCIWWTSRTILARAKMGSCASLQTTDFISRIPISVCPHVKGSFWFHITTKQYIRSIYYCLVLQEKFCLTGTYFFFLWVTTYLEVQAETGRKEEVWGKATFPFTLSGSSPIDGHQSLHSLQSLDSLILQD